MICSGCAIDISDGYEYAIQISIPDSRNRFKVARVSGISL
jgi:hypothetical protein